MLKAVFAWRAEDREVSIKMVDLLEEELKRHHEFMHTVQKDHMEDKRRLHELINQLVSINRNSFGQIAAPVGRSSGPIRIGHETADESILIDEPTAEVLRAKEDLEVGQTHQLVVVLHGVDKTNGACKVAMMDDADRTVRGRITDPALAAPGNVYTRSLDRERPITVTAKPVLKDGQVVTLYVSDG